MDESLLHFIWKFQHFKTREIFTDTGQSITVLNTGQQNHDAGPDFFNAKVRIGDIIWNGNIEIHIHSKDWNRHKHQEDPAYENVVLHVVWKNDCSIHRKDNSVIPTLEIKDLVDDSILLNYNKLFVPGEEILCGKFVDLPGSISILNMKEKALAQRLEAKSDHIFRKLAMTNGDWEEVAWRILCENFGFKTNLHPFEILAKSIPFNVLKKESHQKNTAEALLFGMAGFLDDDLEESYFNELKGEFLFKQKKYKLEQRLVKHQWKFLRLRPANFPTIRIAQLAALIVKHVSLFSFVVEFSSAKELRNGLEIEQSAYWKNHYNFGKTASNVIGNLGQSSIENIMINTVAPILFAYGMHKDNQSYKDKSIDLLSGIKAESNSITKKWKQLDVENKSAFDSQALIELFNNYCKRKRCLDCAVGAEIISK